MPPFALNADVYSPVRLKAFAEQTQQFAQAVQAGFDAAGPASTARRPGGRRDRRGRPRDRRTAASRSICPSTRPDRRSEEERSWRSSSAGSSRRPSRDARAVSTFPAFVVLADGSLLVTYSIGSGKDTDDLTIELRRSTDGGPTWTDPVTPFETTIDGRRGALKAAPITVLDGDHLIVAGALDRPRSLPGPAALQSRDRGLSADDGPPGQIQDAGRTWTPWRSCRCRMTSVRRR